MNIELFAQFLTVTFVKTKPTNENQQNIMNQK